MGKRKQVHAQRPDGCEVLVQPVQARIKRLKPPPKIQHSSSSKQTASQEPTVPPLDLHQVHAKVRTNPQTRLILEMYCGCKATAATRISSRKTWISGELWHLCCWPCGFRYTCPNALVVMLSMAPLQLQNSSRYSGLPCSPAECKAVPVEGSASEILVGNTRAHWTPGYPGTSYRSVHQVKDLAGSRAR